MTKKYVVCSKCGKEMDYHYDDTIPIKPLCEQCQRDEHKR